MKEKLFPLLFLFIIFIFFNPLFLSGKVPIASDTIVGLYHPYRDVYAKEYPRGIPFKNALITDPIRQQYPWRILTINVLKQLDLPLWNPYAFSGTPLLGNLQNAAFYPLNVLFFFFPFEIAWTILVFLQPFLSGIFLYFYLRKINLQQLSSFLGGVVFAFCGFNVAWLEWNTIVHTALWLPLILLAKEYLLEKITWKWVIILIFAESSQFFAGHLQIWFYSFLISNVYLWIRIWSITKPEQISFKSTFFSFFRKYKPFMWIGFFILLLTSIVWIQTFQFIGLSSRDIDVQWQKEGWFLPWQHLIQFVIPDFFGNPSTLNYWGVWNYGEFIGYVSLLPLLFAIYSLLFRYDKKTFFFGTLFFVSLIFSLPSFLSTSIFLLHIPFLSTAQPTRLLFITDFSLAVLAALGCDNFLKKKTRIYLPLLAMSSLFILLWTFIFLGNTMFHIPLDYLATAKRNSILPTLIFISLCVFLLLYIKVTIKYKQAIVIILLVITLFDLYRFHTKFNTFSNAAYLYPTTETISFLKKNLGNYRIMSLDSRILPPNFPSVYKLQSIEGYDPLYLRRYAELIAASERGEPNINPPFGLNRIITPHNFNSKVIDLLSVKYILSLSDISSPKVKKVFQEGETRIYQNLLAQPKVFLVKKTSYAKNKSDAIKKMFNESFNIKDEAIVEDKRIVRGKPIERNWSGGEVKVLQYSENKISIETNIERSENHENEGFVVLTDTYYPGWRAFIINKETDFSYDTDILRTDYNFRGIIVPEGKSEILLIIGLF